MTTVPREAHLPALDEHHPAKPKNYSSFPLPPPHPDPAGLMIWPCAMHDDTLLNIARQAEAALARAIHP